MRNYPNAFRRIYLAVLSSCLCLLLAPTVHAQAGQRRAPMQVGGFRGQYCSSMGPRGWAVIAENPQRVSFGADLLSGDGRAAASYSIFGVGSLNRMPGFENPDRAVAASVSRLGALRVRFGQKQQVDRNVFTVSFQTPESDGMAYYQVVPSQPGGAMVVLRTAYVASGTWKARGAEASAVARSMRCNVPSMPPAPDPPSLNPTKKDEAKGEEGESDSLYNQWLDKEYFHDPKSGENFWVSPSSDWQETGPQGPGYYAFRGNDVIKLQSGYAQ